MISRWKALKENLKLAQAALSLYDFDPDSDRSTDETEPPVGGTGRGSFADGVGDFSA